MTPESYLLPKYVVETEKLIFILKTQFHAGRYATERSDPLVIQIVFHMKILTDNWSNSYVIVEHEPLENIGSDLLENEYVALSLAGTNILQH
ncbi:hypothetical protein ACJX0J_025204, partial [Zea mays]